MKRFQLHVAVDDLEVNIRFYSAMFGSEPDVAKSDYAKWMLENPRINFAISKRGQQVGLNHLGIQVDSDAELDEMRKRLADAAIGATAPGETACCYARSSKYWTTDPQGIAWETFRALGNIPVFGADEQAAASAGEARSCCIPEAAGETKQPEPIPIAAKSPDCCSPR